MWSDSLEIVLYCAGAVLPCGHSCVDLIPRLQCPVSFQQSVLLESHTVPVSEADLLLGKAEAAALSLIEPFRWLARCGLLGFSLHADLLVPYPRLGVTTIVDDQRE